MTKKLKIFKVLLFVVFFVIIDRAYIEVHEEIHKEISKHHGCIKPEIVVDYLTGEGNFRCLEYIPRDDIVKLQEVKLHSWNEIIGYPLRIVVWLITTLAGYLVFLKR